MKKFFTFRNVYGKMALSAFFVCLLALPNRHLSAQFTYTRTFDAPQMLVAQGQNNGWYQDRYAPHSFQTTTFNTHSAIKESISTLDGAVNRPTGYQNSFRNTQGRSIILPDGTFEISVDLYIPASWTTSNKRMAGLWASGAKSDGGLSETYPVLEFTSDIPEGGTTPTPRFQAYDDQTNAWISMGLPTGFTYDTWHTLKINLNPTTEITTYTVGDKSVNVTAADVQVLKSAILQGYNYDPSFTDNETNPGIDYDIYWDNLSSSSSGRNVYNNTAEKYYASIQSAISDAVAGDHLFVTGSGYDEQVLINKTLTLEGKGDNQPVLDFTGTVTGKPSIIDISANNVVIQNLDFHVDLSRLSSAVIASAIDMDSVSFMDNHVTPYKSGETLSSYSTRNAFSVNYASYRVGGDHGIYFNGNTVEADLTNGIIFRSGLSADVCTGQFTNNILQSLNQDLCIRFFKNNPVIIKGNHFNGGGVEIATPESENGLIDIEDNTFDGSMGNSFTSSLRLKDNYDFMPALISNNTFVNHRWAISVENFSKVTIDNNLFTPVDTATYYRHITFNTKDLSTSSGYGPANIGGIVTGNTFNGSSHAATGIAIAFYNHDSQDATIGSFVIGTEGHENAFAATIGKALYLDNSNAEQTTNLVGAFPEYTGLPATTTAYWSTGINATNNKFDVGNGLMVARDMTYYQVMAAEGQLFDHTSDINIGRVVLNTPVINVTKEVAATEGQKYRYPTIQEAINAASANDSIYARAWVYNEDVNVNKEGLKLSGDLHYGTDTTIIMGQLNNLPSLNAGANNVHISNLMVTRAGNDLASFVSNPKVTGVNVAQTMTGIILDRLLVTGNRNGIYLNNVRGTTIQQCDVIFNRTGIQLVNNCDNTVITHNNISDNWTLGLVVYDNNPPDPTHNVTINYNRIAANWYSDMENRTAGTILNLNGNNWGQPTVNAVTAPSGEPGYDLLIPAKYGGDASYAQGNHFQISGALDRVDYTAWLADTVGNAIDNARFPGYIPRDSSVVFIDNLSPVAGELTKMENAQNIVAAGGKIISTSDVLHTVIKPGEPFELASTTGELTVDGIDFGNEENPAPIQINQNITITGTLNLGNGEIKMGEGKTLTIDASTAIDVNNGSGFISGALAVENIPFGTTFTFPVGDSTSGPKYLEFAPTGGTSGSFAVTYSNEGFSSHDLAGDDQENLTSVDQTRFWSFERTSGDLKGKVIIKDYTNSLPSDAVIAHFGSDNKWHNLGGTFIQNSDPQILQAVLESDDFSPFTIGSTTAALPVHLSGFEGKLSGGSVQFSWETLTESNSKGFGLERSKDGKHWQEIAFIPSKSSNGFSTKALHYTAQDNAPVNGLNYYRLRQDRLDLSVGLYSEIKTIQAGQSSVVSVYPNPATNKIYVNGMKGAIYIYNAGGQLLHTQKATSNTLQISINDFPAGIFYIKDDAGHRLKFIKK